MSKKEFIAGNLSQMKEIKPRSVIAKWTQNGPIVRTL
jgi:hypothetical protein